MGLYYLVRILAIAPAAFGGGLPWRVDPMIPFVCAASLGLLGTLVLALTVSSEETARI